MPDGVKVEIKGLREVRLKLGKLDRSMPKTLDKAIKDAAQPIVADAKRRIPLGPPAGGHVQSSVRIAKDARGYVIRAGAARYPYYGWLEYGGHVGRRHRTARAKVPDGRYLVPALRAQRGKVQRLCDRAMARAIRAAGLGRGGI